jgi:hypothetical protein
VKRVRPGQPPPGMQHLTVRQLLLYQMPEGRKFYFSAPRP